MGWGYRGEECDTGPGPPGWDREETGLPWGTGVGAVVGDSPDWSEIIIMKIIQKYFSMVKIIHLIWCHKV